MSDQKDGWRPIESAPKDGTGIILASWGGTSDGYAFPWWLEESEWVGDWLLTAERLQAHLGSFPATHWMPIPPPPGDEGGERRVADGGIESQPQRGSHGVRHRQEPFESK